MQDQPSPQLSSQIQFFSAIKSLEDEGAITLEQKKVLKQKFALKDPDLLLIIAQVQQREMLKVEMLEYLKYQGNQFEPRFKRSSSMKEEMSPLKSKKNDLQIGKQIKMLQNTLTNAADKNLINSEVQSQISQLQEFLCHFNKYQQLGQENKEGIKKQKINELRQTYKKLKFRAREYLSSLLLIKQEEISYQNIIQLMKFVLKSMIDCDEFTYIIREQDSVNMYQTFSDSYQILTIDEQITMDMDLLVQNQITQLTKLFQFQSFSKFIGNQNYNRSFALKTQQTIFIFHQNSFNDEDMFYNFLKLANEYQFTMEICHLGCFLLETIKQAKQQFFSPIQINDQIQEIGLEFLAASKNLLIELYLNQLKDICTTKKIFQDELSQTDQNLTLDLKDSHVKILFEDLNLTQQKDLQIYNNFSKYFESAMMKLCFINSLHDRKIHYCYYLISKEFYNSYRNQSPRKLSKTKLSVIISIREEQNITYNEAKRQYTELFKNNSDLLQEIENYIQGHNYQSKKYIDSYQYESSYELFIRKEEKQFKGFVIIFQESQQAWIKNQQKALSKQQTKQQANSVSFDVQKKIRRSLIEHETINHINQLQQANPEISPIVSMFTPSNASTQVQSNQNLVFRKLEHKKNQSLTQTPKFGLAKFSQAPISLGYLTPSHFEANQNDQNIRNFNFDVLKVTDKIERQRIVWAMLDQNGFIQQYRIPLDKLANFLMALEMKYTQHNNPFHNYYHAVQVMQSSNCFTYLLEDSSHKGLLDNFTRFCLIFSALCHDVAHPGRTNSYQINSLSNLAIRYHDKSVLEQHHAAQTIKILRKQQNNVFVNLTEQDFRAFRKKMIANILHTDMSEHFKVVKEFESRLVEKGNIFGQNEEDVDILCGMLLHTADFSGGAKEFKISRQWSEKVNQEYIAQYDDEGKNGLAQTPFMANLQQAEIMAKQEMGFFKVIVRPLYQTMNDFMENKLQVAIDQLDDTIVQWENVANKK